MPPLTKAPLYASMRLKVLHQLCRGELFGADRAMDVGDGRFFEVKTRCLPACAAAKVTRPRHHVRPRAPLIFSSSRLNLLADNLLGAAIAQRHARAVVFGFFPQPFLLNREKSYWDRSAR